MNDDRLKVLLKATNRVEEGPEVAVDDEDACPLSHGREYAAAARPATKTLTRMHVFQVGRPAATFQYVHLDARSDGDNSGFTFLFVGAKHWQLTVRGRNLWEVYDYLTQHRMGCIRELGDERDYPGRLDEKQAVIVSIEIKDVTPRE